VESIVEAHNADRVKFLKHLQRINHRPIERILRSRKVNDARNKYGIDIILDWINIAKESKGK